jgi:hypothetical protein
MAEGRRANWGRGWCPLPFPAGFEWFGRNCCCFWRASVAFGLVAFAAYDFEVVYVVPSTHGPWDEVVRFGTAWQ